MSARGGWFLGALGGDQSCTEIAEGMAGLAGAAAVEGFAEGEEHAHLAEFAQPVLCAADGGEFECGDLVSGEDLVFGKETEKTSVAVEEAEPGTCVRVPTSVHAPSAARPYGRICMSIGIHSGFRARTSNVCPTGPDAVSVFGVWGGGYRTPSTRHPIRATKRHPIRSPIVMAVHRASPPTGCREPTARIMMSGPSTSTARFVCWSVRSTKHQVRLGFQPGLTCFV